MSSELISAELTATCAALGFFDGDKYHLDSHCLDVIKDLIKYLKRDDDSHTVRQHLGRSKLLETDLKKIFIQHHEKTELWDVLLRLLINLTSPALMVYNEELPSEKTMRSMYEQLVVHLQAYKIAFADDRVWSVVSMRLKNILNMETGERGEENELNVERILTLIRNILQVPPNENEKRTDNDVTVHDEVLFALHTSGLVDMLLFIASNASEQQYHMQVLEIVTLMLTEQCPKKLAEAKAERSNIEKERDIDKLRAIREEEVRERMEKMKKYAGSRHSRFGGTYVVQNMKAIGDNQLICHKPFQTIEALEFGQQKGKVKKPKKKTAIVFSEPRSRTSALSVRLFLKEFCVEFLNGAYNPLMRYARSCIHNGDDGNVSDASCFLWTLRFFMEFNRHYKFQVKYVSETISNAIFHLVQRHLEQYYEMITMDKKKIPLWSKRLHLALKAYLELLQTLCAMDVSSDADVRESSKIIKSNIFYVAEYRETILSQFIHYDESKMSRGYLIDLVKTTHIFIKMLRQFCGQNRTLIVGKKSKKRAKRKKKEVRRASEINTPKSVEDMWDEAGPEVSAVMREGTIPEIAPFDATLDLPIDEQKHEAMKKIQIFLRRKEFESAVGMLRSAREVWPENDCFGKPDISEEEEFLALREIFFARLGVDETSAHNEQNDEDRGEGEDDEEDEEEEANREMIQESNFNFDEFFGRFVNVKIVRSLSLLLSHFNENTDEINHYVVKMLHRIAWDCKMSAMIFQASIFRIFQRILESKSPRHKELQKFAIYIIQQFAQAADKNPKAYMELLFWKPIREAREMVDGYDADPKTKESKSTWTEVEEEELRTLFMEHQTKNYPQDLVDWILENLISDDRTRRSVMKKLKEMCLVANSRATKSAAQKRLPKEWSEEEIAQLTELWNTVKDDQDPVGTIVGVLTIKRPLKAVKEKLLETGLAKDRKELRKKRKERDYPKASWETKSASEHSDSSDEEVERAKKVAPPKKRRTIVYSNAQLMGLLTDVLKKDMREALEWLKESFEEIVEDEDREESVAESVPLVPLSDEALTAMDSPIFQRLLRAIGVESPANEQEAYWRVPASFSVSMIKNRCDLIESVLTSSPEDLARMVTDTVEPNDSEHEVEQDSDQDFPDKLPTVPEEPDEPGKRDRPQDSQESDTEVPLSKKRRVIVNDDDDDIDNDTLVRDRPQDSQEFDTEVPLSKKRRVIINDDDDDIDNDTLVRDRPQDSQESDTEVPLSKKRRVIVSDDDDDSGNDKLVINSQLKSSRRLISDDEDDI